MANPEHVAIFKLGAERIRTSRNEIGRIRFDLSGAELRGTCLRGANLRDADLHRTDLREADLRETNLREAILTDADSAGADLSAAELEGADLTGADLTGAKMPRSLSGARLIGAKLSGVDFHSADLNRANLSGADLRRAKMSKVDLKLANLVEADLTEANLREADLSGANLRAANLFMADLGKTNLAHSHLRGANLVGTSFEGCVSMRGATLLDATIDSTTNFHAVRDVRECFVDRYTQEYMSEYVSRAKRMDLRVHDDLAKLRSQYSGIWMWFHLMSLVIFGAPYVWFVCQQWVLAQLQERAPLEVDSIGLWEAVLRFVWNGGIGWRDGWTLAFWSLVSFLLILTYNVVRGVLLWKTKRLETQQEVSGLPVKFSLGIGFRFWNIMYQITVWGYWLTIVLVLFNTIHFLSIRVPVTLPR